MHARPLPWREYASEAAGLAFFMVNAAILTTLLEYPGSPVHRAIGSAFVRRIPLGIAMGFVIVAIVYSPWGKRSGAHINPAVTWAFYRLGKINLRDAIVYTLAQFVGAIVAAETMKALLGAPFAHPDVKYSTTRPGPHGVLPAFVAELVITFVLVFGLLVFMSSKKLEKYAGWLAGFLIMVYLFFEAPLSGMSLNPARTFGSAFAGNVWDGLWVYFVAPPAGALLAAEAFLTFKRELPCAKLCHDGHIACTFCGRNAEPIPHYPKPVET